ncbi:MAG: AraC family transcriptional regulator [Spirochaetes bacterium]|nr:AraC family transcriptional regulator [Spirochaetota bacterium]
MSNRLHSLFPFAVNSFLSKYTLKELDKRYYHIIYYQDAKVTINGQQYNGSFIFGEAKDNQLTAKIQQLKIAKIINFDPILFSSYSLNEFEKSIIDDFFGDFSIIPLVNKDSHHIKLIINVLEEEFKKKAKGYHTIIRSRLLELFVYIFRAKENNQKQNNAEPPILKLTNYIKNHFEKDIQLLELADLLGWNPSYLSRVFKEKNGVNIFYYISQLRIREACRLLKTTNFSIIEISEQVGFNNLTSFNRTFKKITNRSPRDYRGNK